MEVVASGDSALFVSRFFGAWEDPKEWPFDAVAGEFSDDLLNGCDAWALTLTVLMPEAPAAAAACHQRFDETLRKSGDPVLVAFPGSDADGAPLEVETTPAKIDGFTDPKA